ncbi:MAG: NAD(P)H-binding protein [Bacteroidales bacterium]|nr:NAD(P)H-binding protein [Bacteroidales bacterium]MDT8432760.1 NAD(P)H-binding protein [Bacteroidales bacterium]
MEQIGKTALLFGATGAVGQEVLHLLINDHRYDKIVVFSRKVIPIEHPKLKVILDTLSDLDRIAGKIRGDELFCCVGTTSRKAGSREAFRKVDLDMPVNLARIASRNGVEGFIVISSIGAGSKKTGFYLAVKTEMEEQVIQYDFKRLAIVRPSLLLSDRDEFRFGEEAGKVLDKALGWAMKGKLQKYRGIRTENVARAMIHIMNMDAPKLTWESDELQEISTPKS